MYVHKKIFELDFDSTVGGLVELDTHQRKKRDEG